MRILVVDDHKIFLQGIKSLLKTVPEITSIEIACHHQEAINILNTKPIDIVLLDIHMPHIDGYELLRQIHGKWPNIKKVMLSTDTQFAARDQAERSGANGYLLKIIEKDALVQVLKQIYSGRNYFQEYTSNEKKNDGGSAPIETELSLLSRREKQVLTLIAQEFSTEQIADKLFLSLHTVNSHRKSLLAKLKVKNAAGLTLKAIEFKLIDI